MAIKAQDERRLATLEHRLVPRVRTVIYTGVPRADGSNEVDDGHSALIIRSGPVELEERVEHDVSVGAAVPDSDDATFTIDFDAIAPVAEALETEPEAEVPATAPEMVAALVPTPAAAAPTPTLWQPPRRKPAPGPALRKYPGPYGWMR